MWKLVNGVITMNEISRPNTDSTETKKMFGLSDDRYKELYSKTANVMQNYSREAEFDELVQRLIDITENRRERDCVMWLMGLFYNLSGEYMKQMKEKKNRR